MLVAHPNQTSYFQPILDRLEVVPSRFDLQKSSVIVEGKSDYYVLRYAARMLRRSDLALIPGLGAGTFGALVALHLGWNLNCLFVLDGDKQGRLERERYEKEYGLSKDRLATIDEFASGIAVIEDLLDSQASDVIKNDLKLSSAPTKSQIRRFFQERLAGDKIVSLSPKFDSNAGLVLDAIAKRLQ